MGRLLDYVGGLLSVIISILIREKQREIGLQRRQSEDEVEIGLKML